MTAGDFMYFTLGFIFYKYLSEKIELYINDQLSEDGLTYKQAWASKDEELKAEIKRICMEDLGYFAVSKRLKTAPLATRAVTILVVCSPTLT